ncbi:MAG: GGDEF domain-containing protein, partial [Methylophilaceae bacterium 17-43-7]
ETVAIHGDSEGIRDLISLKDMGVRLSIDDFGTGFSSLSYLKRLPIDTIKIDKSFVRDIKTDANDAAIITAIIKMSHSLNFKVIAEGVETADQLNYLTQYECDEIQGFYFSKPLSAVEFEKLLRSERMLDIFQPVII